MADKPIQLVGGRLTQVEALITSAGAGSSGKMVALDATGRLNANMMPVGVAADTQTIVASETIAAGALVAVYDVAGTTTVRNADATAAGKEADGFILAGVADTENAVVYFEGSITGLTGLTAGVRYYASAATPGAVTATPPSASGNVVQYVGRGTSTTTMSFKPDAGVVLA